MLRRFMFVLAFLAVLGFAAAQITVDPTEGVGDDVIAKDDTRAFVEQLVELILPQATALHLAASTITFDLTDLDGEYWENRARDPLAASPVDYACVYVAGDDAEMTLGADFWGQTQFIPGLVAYEATEWDEIKLIYTTAAGSKVRDANADDVVVTYPPIRLDDDGLVDGSKDFFVCYQSFVIQLFSNFNYYDLQVSRAAESIDDQGIEHLYVQGNPCYDFGEPTGLYDLPQGEYRHLLPRTMIAGPTGTHSGDCNPNSSWMDVLGVLAVKVNADLYGTSTADLTYTLVSSDTEDFVD